MPEHSATGIGHRMRWQSSDCLRLASIFAILTFAVSCRVNTASQDGSTTTLSSTTSMDHKGFDQTCVVCHENMRPAPPHIQNVDCVQCHTPGTYWLDLKYFSHQPIPTSCVRCHEKNRPTPNFWFQTQHGEGADCVGCHVAGTKWTDNKPFSHSPTPNSCVACHETERPSFVQLPIPNTTATPGHFGNQECANCHRPQPQGQSFIFEHKGAQTDVVTTCLPCHEARRKTPDHHAGQDCVGCHINPAKPWLLSIQSPHPQNSPMPSVCASCHVDWRPDSTQYPDSGGTVSGHFGDQDCITCHKPRSDTVTEFEFDHAATGQNIGTCLPCHDSKRPTDIVNRFIHTLAGTGDCASCHIHPGDTWSGGIFSHVPTPAACAPCHATDRPPALINGFLHSAAIADCSNCHHRPGFTWADGNFDHSGAALVCGNCHTSEEPTSPINKMNHSATGIGDCSNCHKQPGVQWAGAVYPHTPVPVSCQVCHEPQRPAVAVGNSFNHTGDCGDCHGEFHQAYDCSTCHFNMGVAWQTSPILINPVPDVCTECHDGGDAPILGPTNPSAPTAFNDGITGNLSTNTPTLTWVAAIANTYPIDHYEIAIGTTPGGLDVANWTNVGNTTSAILSGLSLSSCGVYYASIRAVDTIGLTSNVTQGDGWKVLTGACPTAPNSFTATVSGRNVTLNWARESTANETEFTVQRSTGDDQHFVTIGSTPGGILNYSDLNVDGWTYYYRVAATNATGTSIWSNEANVSVIGPVHLGQFNGHSYMTTPGNCTNSTCTNTGVGGTDTLTLAWGPATTTTNASDQNDGIANKVILNSSTYPAANFCNTLNYAGYTDWYLPAINELPLLWSSPTPLHSVAPGMIKGIGGGNYWSSTEYVGHTYLARTLNFGLLNTGSIDGAGKDDALYIYVRCVRRD